MTTEQLEQMTYEEMLSHWRFAPVGDPLFQGAAGEEFREVMLRKRAELSSGEHARASKHIGWKSP